LGSLDQWTQLLHANEALASRFYESWALMRDKDSVDSLTQTLQPLSQHSFDIALDFARGDGDRQSGPGSVMELLARGSPSPRGDSPLSRSESLTSVSGVWDFDVRDEGSGRTWHCKTVMLSLFCRAVRH